MTTLESRLDVLETMEGAERLKHDYAFETDIWRSDQGRFRRFADLFTSDGGWDDGDGEGLVRGREAMAEKLARLPGIWGLRVGLHMVSNPRFEIEGDSVTAHWQTICALQNQVGGRPGFAVGSYHEHYRHEGNTLRVAMTVVRSAFMSAPD